MKYRSLKARVVAAERRVGEHLDDAGRQITTMRRTVDQAMTPARIVVGGLVCGVLVGWLRPFRHVRMLPSLLSVATSVPSLMAAIEPFLAPIRQGMQAAQQDSTRPHDDV